MPVVDLRTNMPIAGTGETSLWAVESHSGGDPFLGLAYWNGSSVKHMTMPPEVATAQQFYVAATEPGTVWMFALANANRIIAVQIDATGAVVADRSADFPVLGPFETYGRVQASGDRGGLFVETFDRTSHVYRLSGGQFMPVALPAGLVGVNPTVVVGPDEAWFSLGVSGIAHYSAGTWTTPSMPAGGAVQGHGSVDDNGVYYALGSPASEQVQISENEFKLFVNLVKIENDQVTSLRLEWVDGPAFVPDVVIGLNAGSFAIMGTAGSRTVARRGTASGIATSETRVHLWGCAFGCGTVSDLFADRTFILSGGPREDTEGGRNPVLLLGTADDLP